jgi:hypothetical protein
MIACPAGPSLFKLKKHNFFLEGLEGKTPAETCRIKIEGVNKWITLIQNASMS